MVLGRCISLLITVLQYDGVNKVEEIRREKHGIEHSLRKHNISSGSAATRGNGHNYCVSETYTQLLHMFVHTPAQLYNQLKMLDSQKLYI